MTTVNELQVITKAWREVNEQIGIKDPLPVIEASEEDMGGPNFGIHYDPNTLVPDSVQFTSGVLKLIVKGSLKGLLAHELGHYVLKQAPGFIWDAPDYQKELDADNYATGLGYGEELIKDDEDKIIRWGDNNTGDHPTFLARINNMKQTEKKLGPFLYPTA